MKILRAMSHKQKLISIALLLILLVAAVLLFMPESQRETQLEPTAVEGVLDLTEWNLEQDGIVDLKGEWEFYWNQLLTITDIARDHSVLNKQWVQVPNVWTDYNSLTDGTSYPDRNLFLYGDVSSGHILFTS